MKSKFGKRRGLLILIFILLPIAILTQLQPALLHAFGAVEGTFGLRPVSHRCAGLTLAGVTVAERFPAAEWEGTFGFFRIRYNPTRDAMDREFCLGQDIWFGE